MNRAICLFMRQMHRSADRPIWNVLCIASIAGTCVVVVLQLLHVADMRQMLRLIHVMLLLLAAVCVIMLVKEVRVAGLNGKLKKNVFCIVLCAVGLVPDMAIYYLTKGKFQSFPGIFNFLVYNLVLGVSTMREARELMKIGMQARSLEKMAYHDQMTGLYNRTAYADDIGSSKFDPEHYIVVMCDRFNRENTDIVIRIACGYELFDKRMDYNINDISRRADRMMYHEKFAIKQQSAGAV